MITTRKLNAKSDVTPNCYAVKIGLLSALVAASVNVANVQAQSPSVYLVGQVGHGTSDISVRELQRQSDQHNLGATIIAVDDNKHSRNLGLGYDISNRWSLELTYLQMEQVNVEFSANQVVTDIDAIHPEAGDGLTVSGLYRYPLADNLSLRARLGLFSWEAEYDTITATGVATVPTVGKVDDDGIDVYWGVGADYKITNNLLINGEVQRFNFDNADRMLFTLGLQWYFAD